MEQTELAVVNALLKVIGESPVNQIDSGHPDIVTALSIWDEYSTEVQTMGWWFNLETWALSTNTDDKVLLPTTTLTVDGPNSEYIKRGRYLYDLEEHSFDFSAASSTDLTLNLITKWSKSDLPPVIFNYILAKCKLSMLVSLAYDQHKEQQLEDEVRTRYFIVQKHQLRFGKPNAKSTTTAQQLLNAQPTR